MSQRSTPTRVKGRRGSKNSVNSESSVSSKASNSMELIKESVSVTLEESKEKVIILTDTPNESPIEKTNDVDNAIELNGNSIETESKSETEEIKSNENGCELSDSEENDKSASNTMEPLVVATTSSEETELDVSIHSSESENDTANLSPVLNRCVTRRSQTRSVPTPKTPKISNGETDNAPSYDEKIMKRVTVDIEILKEGQIKKDPIPENLSQSSSFHSVEDENKSASSELSEAKTEEESATELSIDSEQDEEDVSLVANYTGDDMTRNVELTFRDSFTSTPDLTLDNSPSFLNVTKDLSYSKTLKLIGGRRNVQDLRQESVRNSYKNYQESKKSSIPFLSNIFSRRDTTPSEKSVTVGIKRKYERSITPECSGKKIKTENGSNLFSYVSSPIDKLKRKLSVTSSIPKTSSYKPGINLHSSSINESVDFNEIDKNGIEGNDSYKRWCNIQ